ncbi:MAG: FtsK/SpoIIIE domain-containing protein [Bacillota bacterium]
MLNEWLVTQKYKSKLKKTFYSGQLYLTHKKKSHVHYILPKIHSIKAKDNSMQIVFTLPLGLDPKEVTKRDWLFKQQFGEKIDLKQENKKFVLTVYEQALNKMIKYQFNNLKAHMTDMYLPIVLGMDKNGNTLVYDMVKSEPHLLIAGSSGSGKSCQLRVVLSALIQHCDPEDLHLYLGDMKLVELVSFSEAKHTKRFATDEVQIESMLNKLLIELEDRKKVLQKAKVKGLASYNKKYPDKKLPYIVLCVDEFGQLKDNQKVKDAFELIAAQGRFAGIFMILATQRPDSKIMDGKLKVNLNVRIGFKCDRVNSRIIIDSNECSKLKQPGQMFYKMDGEVNEGQAFWLHEDICDDLMENYKKDIQTSQEGEFDDLQAGDNPKEVEQEKEPTKEAEGSNENLNEDDLFGVLKNGTDEKR